MQIKGTNYSISKSKDGTIWYDFGDGWKKCKTREQIAAGIQLYDLCKSVSRDATVSDISEMWDYKDTYRRIMNDEALADTIVEIDKEALCTSIMDFFSEFHFEPNLRFLNTLAMTTLKQGRLAAKAYVSNYFDLVDSMYAADIKEKLKATEFDLILQSIEDMETPSSEINKRFKLYYGSQGTGKTTKAMEETDVIMVCHSAMLPQDLMEDFQFDDGKPGFHPSALYKAMENGTKIILDEINLLPFESLRFLQSILDNKSVVVYKGKQILIKDGFQIIGTMNLVVNGCTYALPEPLVDRAQELQLFKLSAKNLICAFA